MGLNTSTRLGWMRQGCSPGLQPQGMHLAWVFFWLTWMLCCYMAFHLTAYELLYAPTFFILGYSKRSWTSKSMSQLPLQISCSMVPYACRLYHLKHKPSAKSGVTVLHMLPSNKCCTSELGLRGKGSFPAISVFHCCQPCWAGRSVPTHSEMLSGAQVLQESKT